MDLDDVVYDQLSHDYPKAAIHWVHSVEWVGPKRVSLSKIDWDHERMWRAAKEPKKVNNFVRAIEKDESDIKPVLLIDRPGEDNLMIPDGHHRALAYQKLGKKPRAYIGTVTRKRGPWDTLHDKQFKDSGDQYR